MMRQLRTGTYMTPFCTVWTRTEFDESGMGLRLRWSLPKIHVSAALNVAF